MVSVALLDLPTRDRVECRSPQRLTGAQAEAGVVPWAADRIRHEHPLGQRTMVMAALGADREHRPTAACQQHRFPRDLAQDHAAFGKICAGNPHSKVRSAELGVLVARDWLPLHAKSPLSKENAVRRHSATSRLCLSVFRAAGAGPGDRSAPKPGRRLAGSPKR